MLNEFVDKHTHLERCLPLLSSPLREYRSAMLIMDRFPSIGQTNPILEVAVHLQRRLEPLRVTTIKEASRSPPVGFGFGLAIFIRSLMLYQILTSSHALQRLVKGGIDTSLDVASQLPSCQYLWGSP